MRETCQRLGNALARATGAADAPHVVALAPALELNLFALNQYLTLFGDAAVDAQFDSRRLLPAKLADQNEAIQSQLLALLAIAPMQK